MKFLSTPSARRATSSGALPGPALKISIHALREEGDLDILGVADLQQISIHALREEGDQGHTDGPAPPQGISIHALREEGDISTKGIPAAAFRFLSTPSARRATWPWAASFSIC